MNLLQQQTTNDKPSFQTLRTFKLFRTSSCAPLNFSPKDKTVHRPASEAPCFHTAGFRLADGNSLVPCAPAPGKNWSDSIDHTIVRSTFFPKPISTKRNKVDN